MTQYRDLICSLACSVVLTSGGCADQAPASPSLSVRHLAAADAYLEAEFTIITSVRELADGRVLISDVEGGDAIHVGDFETGEVRKIGRQGTGPGEYREVNRLWALGGDTTIMVDSRADRWLVLQGAEMVATLPPHHPAVAALDRNGRPDGFDHRGGVVFRILRKDDTGRPIFEDPMFIMRYDRVTGTLDTISVTSAKPLEEPWPAVPRRGLWVLGITPHSRDQIAVLPDGRVAIARVDPYRVDWCAPGGACSEGRQLGIPAEFTDRDKQNYLSVELAMNRSVRESVEDYVGWPLVVPPFAISGNVADEGIFHRTPTGDFLLERFSISERLVREYDLIDTQGRRAGGLELPLQQRIIGFGVKHVYVVTTDELDVPHLSRHPWP